MSTKKSFIDQFLKEMNEYEEQFAYLDHLLENYNAKDKEEFYQHRKALREKFHQMEDIFEKVKESGEDTFDILKDKASDALSDVKDALQKFTDFFTTSQLSKTKDEIIDFGNQKLNEAQALLKEHPLTAAASALTLGFVIGSLFKRVR